MYNKNIRTGVIGVGSMGQNHARIYTDISNLVAVADTNKKQVQKIAKRYNVDYYTDYKEMLGKVDAVTIAVPTIYHKEVAKKVAEAGVHGGIEKADFGGGDVRPAIVVEDAHDGGGGEDGLVE